MVVSADASDGVMRVETMHIANGESRSVSRLARDNISMRADLVGASEISLLWRLNDQCSETSESCHGQYDESRSVPPCQSSAQSEL